MVEFETVFLPYFERKDFACKCGCGQDTVDAELLSVLEKLRMQMGPTVITSANRCPAHNAHVGGARNSQHLLGKAADIQVLGVSPGEIHAYLEAEYPDNLGLGLYNTFVHIDVRDGKARWAK